MLVRVRAILKVVNEFAVNLLLRRILAPAMLTLVYFLVFGPFSLALKLFARKRLEPEYRGAGTYWVEAKGYSPDPAASFRQS